MSGLVKLADDDQSILEQAIDILSELGGHQSRLDGSQARSAAYQAIHRAERSIVAVIETHGENR